MPLEVDQSGLIDYICAQYIVFGNNKEFNSTRIGSVKIQLATSHPSTTIAEEHFVIEISPISLQWVM
ncbi:MAG: hypothetical protein Q4P28_05040 [Tissierellia bacterium]|nr:hypothetical protein [Tissierellia bacterium]